VNPIAAVEPLRHPVEKVDGRPGVLRVEDPLYRAEFTADGFTLAAGGGGHVFALRTERVGGAPAHRSDWSAALNAAEREVSVGTTERVTARDGRLEWDFVIARPPAAGHDLVIEAMVDARGPPRRDGSRWRWEAGQGRSVTMGDLVVLDADGVELYRSLPDVRGSDLELRVPATILETAKYPLTIDPVIKPEYPASNAAAGPKASGDQLRPALAFDGTNYLVVWVDDRDNQVDLYGALVTPDGSVLGGAGFAIATGLNSQEEPAVGFGGSTFYVAWSEQDAGEQSAVHGTPVSTGGVVADPGGTLLSAAPDHQRTPAVVFDGANFLVAWTDERSGPSDIYGTRVSPAGAVLDPDGIAISTAANDQFQVALASAGTGAIATWTDQRGGSTSETWGTSVDQDGEVANAEGLQISPTGDRAGRSRLAFDGTNFLVVWTNASSFVNDVRGARITPAGSVLDPAGITISNAADDQENLALAFDGTNFLVVWEDYRADDPDIYGARVTPAGVLLDATGLPLAVTDEDETDPVVGSAGGAFLVAWTELLEFDGERDVRAVRVTGAGATAGPSVVLSRAAAEQQHAQAAFDGTNYLVVWEQGLPLESDIYAARVAPDGTMLDPAGIPISTAPDWQAGPSVAFDPTTNRYLVVWGDRRSGQDEGWDIYGTRVSTAGAPLDPGGIPISTAQKTQSAPAVVFDGTNFVVAWSDHRGSSADIYRTLVRPDGSVVSPSGLALSTAAGDEYEPQLAVGATNILVAWWNDSTSTIAGIRMNLSGSGVGASFTISSASGDQRSPTVAFDGTNYLVAWESFRPFDDVDFDFDVYGARVTPTGTLLDPVATGIPIAQADGDETEPSAGFDGTNFVVSWENDPRGRVRQDVEAARVSPAGVVLDPGGFPVAASASPEYEPDVVGFPDGRVAVAYARTETAPFWGGAQRAALRVVTTQLGGVEPIVDTGPPSATKSHDATFEFHHPEGLPIECTLDSGQFAPCASPASYTGLPNGRHVFRVRVSNADGSVTHGAAFVWAVDNFASAPTIDTAPTSPSNLSSPTFSFSNVEPSTFECRLDTAEFEACASPKQYTGVTDGFHTFQVRAIDAAGNVSAPDSHDWLVDTVPPGAPQITSGPNPFVNSTSASFTFSSASGTSQLQCRLDSGAFAGCLSPKSYSGLADGAHTFEVRGLDAAGNASEPATRSWTIDRVAPPAPTIDSGPDGPTNNNSPTFTFSSSEPGVTFECGIGGFFPCTSPATFQSQTNGQKTFTLRSRDAAGNLSPTVSRSYTVDTVAPPVPTIDAGPVGTVASTSASFTVSNTEDGVALDCKLDAAPAFIPCPSPLTFNSLAQGSHTLQVRARDAAGNTSLPTSTWSWTVDTVPPPAPAIGAGPTGTVRSTAATFSFSVSAGGATLECSLDGAPFAACQSPLALTGLAQGAHTFRVRSTDAVGNASASVGRDWTVDTRAPNTRLGAHPKTKTTARTAKFAFSSEKGAKFQCKLDKGAWKACKSPITYKRLKPKTHTFQVRAKDAVGNTDTTPAKFTWRVKP
jgi:hypothetical protein